MNKKEARNRIREIMRSKKMYDGPYSEKNRVTSRFASRKTAYEVFGRLVSEFPNNKSTISKSSSYGGFMRHDKTFELYRVTIYIPSK